MTKGAKNIVVLGIVSVIVAAATTSVSLAVYHVSGDIYLDRSRPGFLPDEEEIEEEEKEEEKEIDYVFSENGVITKEVLDEYLLNLNKEVDGLNKFENPFNANALSDEVLGIPAGAPIESE